MPCLWQSNKLIWYLGRYHTNQRQSRLQKEQKKMKNGITYSEKFDQTLREIDQAIADKLGDSFEQSPALLFAIDYVRGEVPVIKQIAEEVDVYEMLDDTFNAVMLYETGYSGFAISTVGWAAPITAEEDEEIAPSKHPQRKRVRLMTLCHRGQMGSSIRFKGEQDVTYDQGNARGSLASAMRDMYDIVRALKVSSTTETERQMP
jgi:hypothetical protein